MEKRPFALMSGFFQKEYILAEYKQLIHFLRYFNYQSGCFSGIPLHIPKNLRKFGNLLQVAILLLPGTDTSIKLWCERAGRFNPANQ